MTQGPKREASRSATGKTLDVVEAAINAPRFSSVVEATALPKATVHRILGELIDHGFVTPTESNGYMPGPKFLSLAAQTLREFDISGIAQPYVDSLARELTCTVHLGLLNGDEVVYIARRDSDKPYRMPSRVGAAVALHSTAIGKAILATTDDEAVRTYARRTQLVKETPRTITDVESLRTELALTRERGFATEREENVPGVTCVGAPIRDHTGRVQYAISVSSLVVEHTPEEMESMAPRVLEAANAIAAALGYTAQATGRSTDE